MTDDERRKLDKCYEIAMRLERDLYTPRLVDQQTLIKRFAIAADLIEGERRVKAWTRRVAAILLAVVLTWSQFRDGLIEVARDVINAFDQGK